MLGYIIQGIVYGFAAATQPGPFQTYLILQTLSRGWRRSLPMVLAPLLSDGPIIILVLAILTQVPVWLVRSLEVAGGVFVIFLAVESWRSWRRHDSVPRFNANPGGRRTIFQAALVNLLNPGPYLFWSLVTGPILLMGWREAPARGVVMLGAFYLTLMGGCAAVILVFGLADRLGIKVTRILQVLSTAALGSFGVYHVVAGLLPCCGT